MCKKGELTNNELNLYTFSVFLLLICLTFHFLFDFVSVRYKNIGIHFIMREKVEWPNKDQNLYILHSLHDYFM